MLRTSLQSQHCLLVGFVLFVMFALQSVDIVTAESCQKNRITLVRDKTQSTRVVTYKLEKGVCLTADQLDGSNAAGQYFSEMKVNWFVAEKKIRLNVSWTANNATSLSNVTGYSLQIINGPSRSYCIAFTFQTNLSSTEQFTIPFNFDCYGHIRDLVPGSNLRVVVTTIPQLTDVQKKTVNIPSCGDWRLANTWQCFKKVTPNLTIDEYFPCNRTLEISFSVPMIHRSPVTIKLCEVHDTTNLRSCPGSLDGHNPVFRNDSKALSAARLSFTISDKFNLSSNFALTVVGERQGVLGNNKLVRFPKCNGSRLSADNGSRLSADNGSRLSTACSCQLFLKIVLSNLLVFIVWSSS